MEVPRTLQYMKLLFLPDRKNLALCVTHLCCLSQYLLYPQKASLGANSFCTIVLRQKDLAS